MHRSIRLAFLLALAACSGSEAPTGPDNPPGPDTTPASLQIAAGDQQVADGGEAVAVAPAVRVLNAGGQPVSGVAVQFTVDAGGGTLTGGNATTNASGVATAGTWTLGPSGEQRVSARAGTLSPVTFGASITPGTELVIVRVGPGGGTVDIPEAGHPFEGLEIDIPAGTWPETEEWVLEATDAPALTLPAGYAIQGPALEVRTDAGRGDDLMTLRVPVDFDDDHNVVIAFYDPARDVLELLPSVARTESHIEVVTAHLNAGLLLGPQAEFPSASTGGPARQVGVGNQTGQLLRILQDLPVAPAEGTVNPWPVIEHGSAAYPDGHGPAIPVLEHIAGMYSALPLFADIVKALDTPGFYAEAGPLAALQIVFERVTPTLLDVGAKMRARLQQTAKAERDRIMLQEIAAYIALQQRPAFVAFNPAQQLRQQIYFGLARQAAQESVTARVPASASPLQMQQLAGQGWGDAQVADTGDGAPEAVDGMMLLPSAVVPFEQVRDVLQRLVQLHLAGSDEARDAINRDLAGQAGLPDPTVEVKDLETDTWAPVADEVEVFSTSTTIRLPGLTPGSRSYTLHLPTGAQVAESAPDLSMLVGAVDAFAGLSPLGQIVATVSLRRLIDGLYRQVVPQRRRFVRHTFQVDPPQVTVENAEDPVDLTAEFTAPMFSGFRIEWDWGDGEVTENLGLVNASHTYAQEGTYQVVASLKPASIDFTLAKDTVQVTVGQSGAWQGVGPQTKVFASWGATTPAAYVPYETLFFPMASSDLFFIARPVAGGMEDIFLVMVQGGTGKTLQQPPTGAGPGGIELLVQRAPEGTLAGGETSLSGSGTLPVAAPPVDYQIVATFTGGSASVTLSGTSVAREPDFGNPYWQIVNWDFTAAPFTPPSDDDGGGGGGGA